MNSEVSLAEAGIIAAIAAIIFTIGIVIKANSEQRAMDELKQRTKEAVANARRI